MEHLIKACCVNNLNRIGHSPHTSVYSDDHPVLVRTCTRNNTYDADMAKSLLAELQSLNESEGNNQLMINPGRGHGCSVPAVIDALGRVSSRTAPYQIANKRPQHLAPVMPVRPYERLLDTETQFNIERMHEEIWQWQIKSPDRYFSGHGNDRHL